MSASLTTEEYDSAMDRLRRILDGEVEETDWPATGDRAAYRYGQLTVEGRVHEAISIARALAELACLVRGYLVLSVHEGRARWQLAVTRALTPEEIAALVPSRVEVAP